MHFIEVPIRRIQMTQMEYVHLQALILFDPGMELRGGDNGIFENILHFK